TCGADRKVRIWNCTPTPIGNAAATLPGHGGPLSALAFSPDGNHIASAGSDMAVKVWDRRSQREVRSYRGHTDWVTAVAGSPDGRRIAGVENRFLRVWDAATGKETHAVEMPEHVLLMSFNSDSKSLLVCTRESGDAAGKHTVTSFDADSLQPLKTFSDSG